MTDLLSRHLLTDAQLLHAYRSSEAGWTAADPQGLRAVAERAIEAFRSCEYDRLSAALTDGERAATALVAAVSELVKVGREAARA